MHPFYKNLLLAMALDRAQLCQNQPNKNKQHNVQIDDGWIFGKI
jgi:hypothetical protein